MPESGMRRGMNTNSGAVWERTRAVAELAVRDPKARESAAQLVERLRELAMQDQRRNIGRMLMLGALAIAALVAVAGIALRRSGDTYS